ncbi:multidrug effflux MFS transporter [Parendozoicomonas sp. Alg238-R29]|uniref:multidrug effflux MFS transporter n=1 Tax=Parendozoicomonas sp. Alg238-R29 TaxID=2993446 RepID=UPI00248EDBCC|nr:multidrug effflux MFS transporter [Parendozoicomonas sp. Alg238-R29]
MSNSSSNTKKHLSDWEFIALTAFMMSLVALSIDMMLPALPMIGADLDVENDNDRQMVISAFMAGMTLCQIIYGPWSDKVGRKPAVLTGSIIFLAGSMTCLLAQDFFTILTGRFLQGCGIAAMRILSITIVRDLYEGRAMARIMSMVMSLFILVPCIAPMAGQITISLSHWRTIFVILALAGMVVTGWYWLRQRETLSPSKRRPFNISSFYQGVRETFSYRVTLGYTLASGLIAGSFTSYLLSSQQIFQGVFNSADKFALYFAMLALVYGAASLLNSRLVVRLGMHRLSYIAISGFIVFSILLLGCVLWFREELPLSLFIFLMAGYFFCLSFLFGNMNAIAMQPLGHLAGTASSVISLVNGVISLTIGVSIGRAFNGTVIPFSIGAVVCGLATLLTMRWADAESQIKEEKPPLPLDEAA